MKAQFIFTPKKSPNLSERLRDLSLQQDWGDYLTHMEGVALIMELKPQAKLGAKQQMYAYYHKVVLSVAISALEHAGYEAMDKTKADHILKDQCAKETMIYNGEEHYYLEDKSKMTKDRLRKFITDCIFFLEEYLDARVPDAEAYKNKQETGYSFRSVKNIKKDSI